MNTRRWTWTAGELPLVAAMLKSPPDGLAWIAALDNYSPTPTGKVLCVCAGASIARKVLETASAAEVLPEDRRAVDLLDAWIDDPTDERFDEMCAMIFGPNDGAEGAVDLSHAVWWALRTATSHTDGCGEALWSLESLCGALLELGFSEAWLRDAGLTGVSDRLV